MLHKVLTTMAFLGVLIALASCGVQPSAAPAPTAAPTAAPAANKVIVLGDISNEPTKTLKSGSPSSFVLGQARSGGSEYPPSQ